MRVEVILPKVDMDMTHGTLAVWHAAEGDAVTKGAALFDIETDKAAMEVEAPATGTLRHLAARPGDRVPVGGVVAYIYPPGTAVGAPAAAPGAAPPAPVDLGAVGPQAVAPGSVASRPAATHSLYPGAPPPSTVAPGAVPPADPGAVPPADPGAVPPADAGAVRPADAGAPVAAPRATPAARAAARAAGVALAGVPGTGPRGRIQADDVAVHAGPAAAPAVWAAQPGPLHVSHRPGRGAPLVLLHGFAADSQAWAPLERALDPERALIRIDLPGHGRSPRRRLRGFADLARMVVEAVDDAARAHGSVHLLGHSLGGALALATADIRPRRVASLTLIAPAGLGPEIDAAALTGIARATRADTLAPWLRRLTATPDGISDAYARAAMLARADPQLRACQAAMALALFPDGVQPFDLRPALARLVCPTALIWGRQDHIVPHGQALAAAGDFAIHLLSGAGHVPQIECPDRVARIVARHLAGAGGER